MEPMAVVGLVAATTNIIRLGASTIQSLHVISEKYSDAPATLDAIQRECTTINATLEELSAWIKSGSLVDDSRIASLHSAMTAFEPSIMALQKDVEQIAQKDQQRDLGKRGKLRYIWHEEVLRSHLEEVRWGNNALTGLLVATTL